MIRATLITIKQRGRLLTALAAVAAAAWGSYVVLNRIRADSWRQAGDQALAQADYQRAQQCLDTALRLRGDDAETHRLLARTARWQGRFEDSDAFLKQSLRLGGPLEPIALEEQLVRLQQGDLGAESLLGAYVAANHPETREILAALARGQLANFRIGQALATSEELLRRWPDFVEAHVTKGRAFFHSRSHGEAVAAYRRAVELQPEHDGARAALAECLLLINEPGRALEEYETLRQRLPDDVEVRLGLARALLQVGRPNEVRDHAEAALGGPLRGEALQLLGKLELDLGNPAAAEPWLRQAAELIPYERDVVHAYVGCLAQLGRDADAKDWQERLLNIDRRLARLREVVKLINARPDDPEPRREAGAIFLSVGHEREGLRWLQSAVRVAPRHGPTHAALAGYYRGKGDGARAAEHEKLAGP